MFAVCDDFNFSMKERKWKTFAKLVVVFQESWWLLKEIVWF